MTQTELEPKGAAVTVVPVRAVPTDAQAKKALAKAETEKIPDDTAVRLAQIVNLHIGGMSLAQIGASIGATADEVDRMLQSDAQRYVRSQPALRVYVRNWISERYTGLLEAVWTEATDRKHKEKLENQDRAVRILDRMAKLHGADAPTQAEVKVDAAPEAVDRLVQALAASQGLGYDASIFDVEVVEETGEFFHDQTEVSGNAVGESDGDDTL